MHRSADRAAAAPPSADTRIAAIALLTAAVIFALVSWRDPGYARLHLSGAVGNPGAHRDVVTFVVEAAPFSLIELEVNGHRSASAYVPWNSGEVRFENTPLDVGPNVVVARTTLWYAALRRTHVATIRVDNPAAIARGTHGVVTGSRGLRAPSRYSRVLALTLRQQEVGAAFAVQLPRSDRTLLAVRSHRIDLPAFVDDVFGAPRFNRKPISGFFARLHPRFYAAGDTITVSADSGYQHVGLEYLPAFAGDVEVTNAFTGPRVRVAGSGDAHRPADVRRWARDTLRLGIDDYRVVAREPVPRRTDRATFVWERPFAGVREHVAVSLAFAPFSSVDALRRGLNLPVFAYVPHVVARFLAFFHGFVLAAPMFGYLVLSRGRNTRLATAARRLIVVAVAADVFDACISAQPDVDGEILLIVPALRAMQPSLVNLLLVPMLIGLVLALLAWSAARLAARARSLAATVISDGSNAVFAAALGFVAIAAAGYAAGGTARASVVYPALVGTVLAVGVIAILVSLDWWTIPRRGGPRCAFTMATVAFAVAVAVPTSLIVFGAWATFPERAGTAFADPLSPLPLSATFLRSLAPLCPLTFGVLLLAGVRPDAAALGLDRAALIRLVMCSYAVLAGVVAVVPIGFVLAWSTYGLLRRRACAIAPARDASMRRMTPRERGFAAIPLAIAFAFFEVLLLAPSETRHLHELHTPFIALEAAGFLAVIVASLVMPAFAFAACNEELAGYSGLHKGLKVGAWVIACSLPAWFLRSDSLMTAIVIVVTTATFYAVLGCITAARHRVRAQQRCN